MSEAKLWQYLKKGLYGKALTTRLESSVGNGVPDVIIHLPGKHIFMELKYIPEWPKRATTLVKLPLRSEQRLWIKSRGSFSGNTWVFIRIEDDFFLLPWDVAEHLTMTGFTQKEWLNYPFTWYKNVNFSELVEILQKGK